MQPSATGSLNCHLNPGTVAALKRSSARIHVTGCSGWFGRCLLEALHLALGAQAFADRVRPYTSAGKPVALRNGLEVKTARFDDLANQRDEASVVLNFAYLTKEQAAKMPLQAYVDANRRIVDTVFSALDGLNCQALFAPSSGAVYRPAVQQADWTDANAYGKLKLDDEQRALQWAKAKQGRRAIICRVFNVSGPYINKYSDYALSSIIDSVLRQDTIRIRSDRHTWRSYVAIDELLSLVMALLFTPEQESVVFDSAGEDVLEINDLIRAVNRCLPNQVAVERPPLVDGEDRYLGDRAGYAALLGRHAIITRSLDEQIRQTADYIRKFPGH